MLKPLKYQTIMFRDLQEKEKRFDLKVVVLLSDEINQLLKNKSNFSWMVDIR